MPAPASAKIILPKSGAERTARLHEFYSKAVAEGVPLRSAEKKYGLPSNCLESYATSRDLPKPQRKAACA